MACRVCDTLPLKRVQSIDRHLVAGKKSLMAIAEHYAVDIGDLRLHMVACLQNQQQPNEDGELLQSQRNLQTLITQFQQEIAEGKHLEFDPETGMDGRGTIGNLLSAMREHRETVLARSKIRTAEEVYQGLQENVVGPFINAVTTICIEEGRRTREEIFNITKRQEELHPKIKKAVDDMLERVADRMSSEALHDVPDRVKAVVGAKKQNQGRPVPQH
jgi:hypothetical protein